MNGEIVNTYSTTLRRITALACATHEPNNVFVSFDISKMVRNETQPRDFVSSPSRSGIVLATQINTRKEKFTCVVYTGYYHWIISRNHDYVYWMPTATILLKGFFLKQISKFMIVCEKYAWWIHKGTHVISGTTCCN